MGPKKPDPISDKARVLNNEIAALEAEIKKLDSQLARAPAPRFRSTAIPPGATASRPMERPKPVPPPKSEPVFEDIKRGPLTPGPEAGTAEIYNDLGLRRYDLPALWHRLRNHFNRPTASNPRLVSYLAAGSVQGLHPLRREKRIARRRFLVLSGIFLLIMLGLMFIFWRR